MLRLIDCFGYVSTESSIHLSVYAALGYLICLCSIGVRNILGQEGFWLTQCG